MKICLFLALAAAAASPAEAGMTAVYASTGTKAQAMKVEIGDDGRQRVCRRQGNTRDASRLFRLR